MLGLDIILYVLFLFGLTRLIWASWTILVLRKRTHLWPSVKGMSDLMIDQQLVSVITKSGAEAFQFRKVVFSSKHVVLEALIPFSCQKHELDLPNVDWIQAVPVDDIDTVDGVVIWSISTRENFIEFLIWFENKFKCEGARYQIVQANLISVGADLKRRIDRFSKVKIFENSIDIEKLMKPKPESIFCRSAPQVMNLDVRFILHGAEI